MRGLPCWYRVCWVLLLPGLLAACNPQKDKEKAGPKVTYTGPLLESQNVLMIFSDSAKLQVKLRAPLQRQFENGDQEFPKGVQVTFFGENGQRVINTLRGNYGKYDKNKNLYLVRGNVKVRNDEKRQQLNTEELFFNQQKGMIYTAKETAVRVKTETEVWTGFGLEANQEFSSYKIMRPTGIFTVQGPAAN